MYETLIRQLNTALDQNSFMDKKNKRAFGEQIDLLSAKKIPLLDFYSSCIDCIDSLTDTQGFCFDEMGPEGVEELKNIFIEFAPIEFYKAKMAKLLTREEKELFVRIPAAFGLAYKNMIKKINLSEERSVFEKREVIRKLNKIAQEYYEKTQSSRVYLINAVKSGENSEFEDLKLMVFAVRDFLKAQPTNSAAVSLLGSLREIWTQLDHDKKLSKQRACMIFKKWAKISLGWAEKVADLQSVLEEFQFKLNIIMLIEQFAKGCSVKLLADIKSGLLETKDLALGFEEFCRLVPRSSAETLLLKKIEESSLNYFNIFGLPRAPSPEIVEDGVDENRQSPTQFFVAAAPKKVTNFYQSRESMKFV